MHEIRAAKSSDKKALHAVRAAAFADVFKSFRSIVGPEIAAVAFARSEAEQAELLDSFFQADPAKEILVAIQRHDESVGFIALSCDEDQRVGEIVLTAVHPAHAGQGIGTKLNQAALARMRERGMIVATVGTGGDASHAAARRAYEKSGFGAVIPSLIYFQSLT